MGVVRFCIGEMEVKKLVRIWRIEEDEKNKKKKKQLVIVKKMKRKEKHLVAKVHVI